MPTLFILNIEFELTNSKQIVKETVLLCSDIVLFTTFYDKLDEYVKQNPIVTTYDLLLNTGCFIRSTLNDETISNIKLSVEKNHLTEPLLLDMIKKDEEWMAPDVQ